MGKITGTKPVEILVEFESIIDLDFAMLSMVQSEYNNPKFIDQSIMHLSAHDVKSRLLNRKHECPLSICVQDLETAINLYKEIMETQYTKLLSYQTPTGVFKLTEVYDKNDGTNVTILCQSNEEVEVIRLYDKTINVIVVDNKSEVDVSKYDVFILKSYANIFSYTNKFVEKHIFVLDYRFNLTFGDDGFVFPDLSISKGLVPINRVGMVNVYEKSENIKLNIPNKPDVSVKPKEEN